MSGGQPVKGAAAAGSPRRPLTHYYLAILAALSCALPDTTLIAQTAYRYRDGSGQWVFTDRAAKAAAPADTFSLGHEGGALHLAVERTDTAESTELTAINDCLCVVTFQVAIVQSDFATIPSGAPLYGDCCAGNAADSGARGIHRYGQTCPAVCLESSARIAHGGSQPNPTLSRTLCNRIDLSDFAGLPHSNDAHDR